MVVSRAAGRNGQHADALGRPLHRGRLGELRQPGLCRRVDAAPRCSAEAELRADVDDHPSAARDHGRDDLPCQHHGPDQVDVDHTTDRRRVGVEQRLDQEDRGVVDEHVHPAHRGRQGGDRGQVRLIIAMGRRSDAKRRGDPCEPRLINVG